MQQRPIIEYPCPWEFKAIGTDEMLMRAAIAEIVADREHSLEFSRTSAAGKYCSLLLALVVESEDHRNTIFVALKEHPHITMVI